MSSQLVNLEGPSFQFKKKGVDAPTITIHAKDEKTALKQLKRYVERFGESVDQYEMKKAT